MSRAVTFVVGTSILGSNILAVAFQQALDALQRWVTSYRQGRDWGLELRV